MPFSEMPLRTSRWDAWSRPPWWIGLPSTRRTAVTSAVSRIGIASTSSGMMSVAIVDSATFQLVARPSEASVNPITWLPESPMKTAAGLPGTEVEREEAGHGERERERDHQQEVVVVDPDGIDREEQRGDHGKAPGEAVHVVEEVEGVRDRHEPQEAERRGGDVVLDDLDADARCEHDARRGELPDELDGRGQRAEVVDQAEREDDRGAARDARELPCRLDGAGNDARADPRQQAEEDADAAEQRCVLLVPAVGRRGGDEAATEAVAKQQPDRQRGDRKGDDSGDGAHRENGSASGC